ncbi:MAG: HesA/MoeB/ThiF family protein [Gaiellaceae bacterium]
MKARLDFPAPEWKALNDHLLQDELEQAAYCLAEPVTRGGLLRLLVRALIVVPPERLIRQTSAYLETDPVFLAPILKRARGGRYALVIAHSHPFSQSRVGFSSIDDGGEVDLIPKVQARAPQLPHAALVLAHGAAAARVYLADRDDPVPATVRVIGMPVVDVGSHGHIAAVGATEKRYDRQMLVWGEDVQRRLGELRVGIVGNGGTGSHASQQLLHVGIGSTYVVDTDVLDETSLNRVVGGTAADAANETSKVEIARRTGAALGREDHVEVAARSALEQEVALELTRCDIVFGCTDNLASRRLLNRLALQYYIPLIDVGMDLERGDDGTLRTGAGRVTLVLPDGPCLHQAGVLVGGEVPPGYVTDDPRPAVVAFNGVVASLGVATLLALIGAYPLQAARQIFYRPLQARLQHDAVTGLCLDCAEIRGVGGSRPLPWDYDAAQAVGDAA